MPESLPIAIALIAVALAAWDTARHYMQLAHGRLLAADKAQAFERELTAQSTRLTVMADSDKETDAVLNNHADRLKAVAGSLVDVDHAHKDTQKLVRELQAQMNQVASTADIGSVVRAMQEWQAKAEMTFAKLSEDVVKRDAAITNVAEEVKKLIERDTMRSALNTPRPRFAGNPG